MKLLLTNPVVFTNIQSNIISIINIAKATLREGLNWKTTWNVFKKMVLYYSTCVHLQYETVFVRNVGNIKYIPITIPDVIQLLKPRQRMTKTSWTISFKSAWVQLVKAVGFFLILFWQFLCGFCRTIKKF